MSLSERLEKQEHPDLSVIAAALTQESDYLLDEFHLLFSPLDLRTASNQ